MDSASDIAHDWIIKALNGENVNTEGAPADAVSMWMRYRDFIHRYQPETLGASLIVRSDAHNYVETIDFLWLFEGSRTIGLVETQALIPPDLSICLAGAARADYVMDPDAPESRRDMPEYDKLAILHVRPRFATLLEVGYVSMLAEAYMSGDIYPDVYQRFVTSRPDPDFVSPEPTRLARKYLM